MNMAACMLAACNPCTFRRPAFRSSALYSFISRLLLRVHAADSYEHHAVPTVASAIISAVTGSIHFFFCDLLIGVRSSSDRASIDLISARKLPSVAHFVRAEKFQRPKLELVL